MKRPVLVGLLWCCASLLSAQFDLVLEVRDSANAEPVPGASASLIGPNVTTTADANGRLVYHALPAGKHCARIVAMGYSPRSICVELSQNTLPIIVLLTASAEVLDEAIVVATRTGSRIEDVPQKIEVLGTEDLEEEGLLKPGNIASLIGDISSVQVQQISAVSGASQVRLQGLQGRHTLMLRDGLPAYGGVGSGFDILRLPPLDLQQVEMLKGPSSTFHGGGAIAGAIDFITRTPVDSVNGLVMVNASSLAEYNANAYVNGPLSSKTGFTLFAGHTIQRPQDVDGDGWSDVPQQQQTQVHPQVFLKPWPKGTVRIGLVAQQEERKGGDLASLDNGFDTAHYVERIDSRRLSADLIVAHHIDEHRSITAKGTMGRYWQHARNSIAPDVPELTQDNAYAESYYMDDAARRTIVLGCNYWGVRAANTGSATLQDLSTFGSFAQLALHRSHWPSIELGLRADRSGSYGVFVLPSFAALYRVSDRFTARANIGTGYQLPDRTQPYGLVAEQETLPALLPGTEPERSIGGTAEWTWRAVVKGRYAVFIDQTFFLTRISHPFTVYSGDEGMTWLANAEGYTITRGIDNYLRVTRGGAELYLGYTWTVPEQVTTTSRIRIAYTPEHRAAATLSYKWGEHWRTGLEASYNGVQRRYDGSMTPDQWFVAAMVGHHRGRWDIVLNCENGLDIRQTRYERTVVGTSSRPVFLPLWTSIDGRVLNLSAMYRF